MFSWFRRGAAALAVLVAAGCANDTNSPRISTALSAARPETMGTVVISLGARRSDRPYQIYALEIRDIASKEEVYLPFNVGPVGGTPVDFNTDDADVAVIAIKLPAGRYEIYNFAFTSGGLNLETKFSLTRDISLPFAVKAGEVSYIGEFVGTPAYRKKGSSEAVEPAGGVWVVQNKQSRDIERAKAKLPGASFDTVSATIPDVRAIRAPFFVQSAPQQRILLP